LGRWAIHETVQMHLVGHLVSNPADRRPLFVSGNELEVGGIEGGNVGVRIATPEVEALLPALDLVLRLSPAEARTLAAALLKWSSLVGVRQS